MLLRSSAGRRRTPTRREVLLDLLHWLFVRAKADSWTAAWPFGLTPTQISILRVVRSHSRLLDLTSIAAELGCSRTTVSRSVGALERKTVVVRVRDPYDGRRVLVKPVAAGWEDDVWDPGYGEDLPGRIYDFTDAELVTVTDAIRILLKSRDPVSLVETWMR